MSNLRDVRIAAHPRAAALVHRVRLVVVQQHLEIRERGVRVADQLDDLLEPRFLIRGEPARHQRIARERQRERAGIAVRDVRLRDMRGRQRDRKRCDEALQEQPE
jgi:hypothetical protein